MIVRQASQHVEARGKVLVVLEVGMEDAGLHATAAGIFVGFGITGWVSFAVGLQQRLNVVRVRRGR